MKIFNRGWKVFLLCLVAQACRADVSPISISFFGVYGSPVQPLSLASSTTDAIGFFALGEWNPSSLTSIGLGYERTTFYSSSSFQASFLSLEGRVFPLENMKGNFSPYLYGGAGISLEAGGNLLLKAGLGSRVSLVAPLYLDIAAGSHWVQDPGSFQYVDVRAGLSYSFDINTKGGYATDSSSSSTTTIKNENKTVVVNKDTKEVKETPKAVPTPTTVAMDTPTPAPVVLELPEEKPAAKNGPDSGPVTAIAAKKSFYRKGMNAFLKGDYKKSLEYLKKSLEIREAHVAPYYYAESYATLGVIYHFHVTSPDHKKKALKYYQAALKIDPTTKSAKLYYKKLKAESATSTKPTKKAVKKAIKKAVKPKAISAETKTDGEATSGTQVSPESAKDAVPASGMSTPSGN